jgi:hypothetical protein
MTRQETVFVDNEPYYAAFKAQEVLDMTYSGVRNQVISGNIKAVTPKGKRQLYYRARDVERLARDLKKLMHKESMSTDLIVVRTREEMAACLDISRSVFGGGIFTDCDMDEYMRMIEKNPDICFALKSNNQIVGYTGIAPLKLGVLPHVLAQTLPVKILPDEMELFDPGVQIDLFLTVMAVKPDVSLIEKRMYGSRLVSDLIDRVKQWGRDGVDIKTIAARSNTPDGLHLLRHIGFTEVVRATPERRTFVIRVEESGIPFIEEYKRALSEWRRDNA